MCDLENLVNEEAMTRVGSQRHRKKNVPIIRRNNCIYATLGICHSVWMNVWYAGCVPDSHPYRVTIAKCRIYTVISPDDGHIAAGNM